MKVIIEVALCLLEYIAWGNMATALTYHSKYRHGSWVGQCGMTVQVVSSLQSTIYGYIGLLYVLGNTERKTVFKT